MKTILFYVMGVTSLAVLLFGAFMLVALILYAIENMWAKHSALAHNVKDYLFHKDDFRLYQHDIAEWDKSKNRHQMECRECLYRKEHMEAQK